MEINEETVEKDLMKLILVDVHKPDWLYKATFYVDETDIFENILENMDGVSNFSNNGTKFTVEFDRRYKMLEIITNIKSQYVEEVNELNVVKPNIIIELISRIFKSFRIWINV